MHDFEEAKEMSYQKILDAAKILIVQMEQAKLKPAEMLAVLESAKGTVNAVVNVRFQFVGMAQVMANALNNVPKGQ